MVNPFSKKERRRKLVLDRIRTKKQRSMVKIKLQEIRLNTILAGEAPLDFEEYDVGAPKGHLCPICDDPHKYYKNHNSEDDGGNSLISSFYNVYFCKGCQEAYDTKSKNTPKNELDLPIRLQQYIYESIINPPPHWTNESEKTDKFCYFCRSPHQKQHPISSPVSSDDWGAVLYACDACAKKAGYEFERHYVYSDSCAKCTERYPLTEQEYQFRVNNAHLREFVCPKCMTDMYGSNHYNLKRYFNTNCLDCNELLVVDRSHNTYPILDPETSPDLSKRGTHPRYLRCKDCNIIGEFEHVQLVGSPTKFWLGIAKQNTKNNEYDFTIFKCNATGKLHSSVKVMHLEGFPNIFDASVEGTEALLEMYNPLNLNIDENYDGDRTSSFS